MTDELAGFIDPMDVQACMEFLILRDAGTTIEDIGKVWNITGRAVQYRVKAWKVSGVYEIAAERYLATRDDEFQSLLIGVQAAVREVLADAPGIIRRMLRIAKGEIAAHPRTQWEVWAWLQETYVGPAMELLEEEGRKESAYAQELEDKFDPVNITPGQTAFLPKD